MASATAPTRATPANSVPSSRVPTPRPLHPSGPTNDHTVSFRHKLSQKEYPPDCPPLNVRWYYAIDVPKRKPFPPPQKDEKPPKPPSKYVPFAARDSREIEAAFRKLSEAEDAVEGSAYSRHTAAAAEALSSDPRESPTTAKKIAPEESVRVAVNEDYLFDVDVRNRELSPVYWLGPVYDVRRGTWFFQEGSTLRPCDENLATQIEDGYLRMKPFRNTQPENQKSKSLDPANATVSSKKGPDTLAPPELETPITSLNTKSSSNNLKEAPPAQPQQTWRLFGAHLNSFVVFVDPSTAWLLTDDFYGKLSSTVFQRISAGSHMGGLKIVRGYSEGVKPPEKKEKDISRPLTPTPESEKENNTEIDKKYKRKSMPPPSTQIITDEDEMHREQSRLALERKMSSFVVGEGDQKSQEEMLESEMKEDYIPDSEADDPGREIEHLLLVTHGIGQKLSTRMESVNFVHDVNVLRKSLKNVYGISPDLQVLNDEVGEGKKNCRVQCLPVCWRHLLDFPQQSVRQNRGEHDLGSSSSSSSYEEEYPSLKDITVEGVPAVRSLITDLALDILLYQSATYREHIAQTVLRECNRIYALFKQRNPEFRGKVSLVGHSLGSAILFDILCRQPDGDENTPRFAAKRAQGATARKTEMHLDFPVENFFCLGSPVGLFQMLKGRTIAARNFQSDNNINPQSPLDPDLQDPFGTSYQPPPSFAVSSPKCSQLFNIFHPTDPISYRIEPLVSKAMAELKPQPLPYTKRGLFGSDKLVGGISGIGQTVSRSVSSMWTSFSSGIASSILNRSLGFNDTGNISPSSTNNPLEDRKPQLPYLSVGSSAGSEVEEERYPPTLIDEEIETLYAGFQRRRKSAVEAGEDGKGVGGLVSEAEEIEAEERGKRLRFEEAKVRALNATGRIDFAIQEGVFDISLIASIASHLSYWGDEDVNHFIISQLLSRQRVMKKKGMGNWSSVQVKEQVPRF